MRHIAQDRKHIFQQLSDLTLNTGPAEWLGLIWDVESHQMVTGHDRAVEHMLVTHAFPYSLFNTRPCP